MPSKMVFVCVGTLTVLVVAAGTWATPYIETFDIDENGWEYWTTAEDWAPCPWQDEHLHVPADLNPSLLLRLVGYRELGLQTGLGGDHTGEVFTVDIRGAVPSVDGIGMFLLLESAGVGTWAAGLALPGTYDDWQSFTVLLEESLFVPLRSPAGSFDNMVENITGVFLGNPGIGTQIDNAGWTPEPATLGLLVLGSVGVLRRRKRPAMRSC